MKRRQDLTRRELRELTARRTWRVVTPPAVRACKPIVQDVYRVIANECLAGPALLDDKAIATAANVSPRTVHDAIATLLAIVPPVIYRKKQARQKSVYTTPIPRTVTAIATTDTSSPTTSPAGSEIA